MDQGTESYLTYVLRIWTVFEAFGSDKENIWGWFSLFNVGIRRSTNFVQKKFEEFLVVSRFNIDGFLSARSC